MHSIALRNFDAGRPNGDRAFTMVEVLVSVALLGIALGSSLWGLSQANNYAFIARLQTGAENVAQNQIDKILSEAPFNPQSSQVPDVLALGITVIPNVEIYNEPNPAGGQRVVKGQMATAVTAVTNTKVNGSITDLNLYSATVTVSYVYRGKTYNVQLNAMRASDV
ncbi:MAG: type II secretion system GspH family protein [Verrucomicrobiota bacterium]|nr:type II secretion system GspH family protein [Verrucomicrobiota bacterium]